MLSVHIMRPKNHEGQTEQPSSSFQVQFHRELGYSVRIFRLRNQLLMHGKLVASIYGDGGCVNKTPHIVVHRRID